MRRREYASQKREKAEIRGITLGLDEVGKEICRYIETT